MIFTRQSRDVEPGSWLERLPGSVPDHGPGHVDVDGGVHPHSVAQLLLEGEMRHLLDPQNLQNISLFTVYY